jgi:hypothetical protein
MIDIKSSCLLTSILLPATRSPSHAAKINPIISSRIIAINAKHFRPVFTSTAMRFFIISLLPLLAAALPAPQTTCGTDKYTAAQILAAKNAACDYVSQGSTAGGSKYPESYQDREGFTFAGVDGPYYEFPILISGKVYTGGKFSIVHDLIEITHTDFAGTHRFSWC